MHKDMSDRALLEHIDAVDAFARTLFVRVKTSSLPLFAGTATTVRQLHLALRHLRVEAADPDSSLRSPDESVYASQLRSIVEDCGFALKQLETVLDKSSAGDGRETDGLGDRVTTVRSRIAVQTTSIDMFLDTVQLHNPENHAPEVDIHGNDESLEKIKDKVDDIAKRLYSRRGTSGDNFAEEDQMWQNFKSELEMEGFSPRILQRHKDVLRAYIRELQAGSSANGGAPPTVRGLLKHATMNLSPPPLPPKEPLQHPSPKEAYLVDDDGKYMPRTKMIRRMPDHKISKNNSLEEGGSKDGDSIAVISTKDLLDMDNINNRMAGMHLHPTVSHISAPQPRSSPNLLPSGMAGSWPPSQMASGGQPPPTHFLEESPSAAFQQIAASPAPAFSSSPRTVYSLAPDQYGKEILMDAVWTKVKRSLISPEILERAGVRYEARPDYVAILGRLSREQVAEYAKQSANCRAARSGGYHTLHSSDKYYRDRADARNSHQDNNDEGVVWDESDATDYDDDGISERGNEGYPYIVNPPHKSKTLPSKVLPKPILKNKNANHVRFDPEPHEVEIKTSRSYHDGRRDNGYRRHREHRDRRDDRSRWVDDRSRHSSRSDRDPCRDRRQERNAKRKNWGGTIGAVGIGGAAASLLGVLAEAAVGS